jgi:hypothetical protein
VFRFSHQMHSDYFHKRHEPAGLRNKNAVFFDVGTVILNLNFMLQIVKWMLLQFKSQCIILLKILDTYFLFWP